LGIFKVTKMDSKCLEGKAVLVTGASRGIGRAIAEAFSRQGSRVMLNYNKSADHANDVAAKLASEGHKIDLFQADVSQGKEVEKMIDSIVEKYGRLDVLVNNAGIRKDAFLAMMSDEDWNQVIDTNLRSVYYACKWASRAMIRQRKGKIINITSLSALKGLAGQTNYSALKGGVISFTKSLAMELATYGIQVNAVAPGLIETDMTKGLGSKKDDLLAKIPFQRFGKPSDVAGGVLFLASEKADYITGYTLAIDGGIS